MQNRTPQRFFNVPNSISLFRILLVPVFLYFILKRNTGCAFAVFLGASLSDGLDGLAARLLNQKTKIGAILDPAADKLAMTTAYIILSLPAVCSPNIIPIWLTAAVLGRDILISGASLILFKVKGYKDFKPTLGGKISTIFQFLVVVFVLFFNLLEIRPSWLIILYIATMILTVTTAVHYTQIGIRILKS
ncbi:MAG: CDP-alcohol phosphatidyltransferase family protein [Candidatus Aminicenantes bacterium]|nr:CDP-alcohol phosphatidyltransferase family protein [Candidatus Aminicenantes bacterium]